MIPSCMCAHLLESCGSPDLLSKLSHAKKGGSGSLSLSLPPPQWRGGPMAGLALWEVSGMMILRQTPADKSQEPQCPGPCLGVGGFASELRYHRWLWNVSPLIGRISSPAEQSPTGEGFAHLRGRSGGACTRIQPDKERPSSQTISLDSSRCWIER